MLLYELAIVLDERSPDVVDAAAELGFGDLQAGSDLDAQQVAALRAHFSGGAVPPPLAPLGSGMPPLPAAPSGPLAAEPLVFGGPGNAPPPPPPPPTSAVPQAPASWGPPPGAAAPPMWGPPPGAAPPTDGEPHVGPYFTAPDQPVAEVVDAPLGLGGVTMPPPPPAGPPPGASPPATSGGVGTGQKVAIGAAVVAVVALFGFMAVNTGPDHGRQREIAAKEQAIEAELAATTTAPVTTTTAAPTTTTAAPAQDAYAPVDVDRFCQGGLGVATFELRLAAAIADGNFPELAGLVRDRRAGWNGDVDTMSSGAAPILVNDIQEYRQGYDQFFDAVASSGNMDEVYAKVDRVTLARSTNAAQQVGAQVEFECK